MHLNSNSFLSQDDSHESGCTPRDHDRQDQSSPRNRKKRGRFFAIFGKSNAAEERVEDEPSHFAMSQDDSNQCSLSQFSQDFGDRIAALSMKSQDYNYSDNDSRSALSTDQGFSFQSNSNNSTNKSKFVPFSSIKPPPLSQSKYSNKEVPTFSSSSSLSGQTSSHTVENNNTENSQKQITVASAIKNPFIKESHSLKRENDKLNSKRKPM